jgi:Transcriptional regulators
MKENKSTHIANEIESRIVSGVYPAGSSLPPQLSIAEEFNTSLRSVREALKMLEAKGLIDVQQGKTATISDSSSFQLIRSLSLSVLLKAKGNIGPVFTDLIKVLTSFSTNAVRVLTSNREEHTGVIELSKAYVANLHRAVGDPVRFAQTEVQILELIFDGADNTILSAIYVSLEDVMRSCLSRCKTTVSSREKRARDYTYLINAISEGQIDLAVAMILMLLNTIQKEAEDAFPEDNMNEVAFGRA